MKTINIIIFIFAIEGFLSYNNFYYLDLKNGKYIESFEDFGSGVSRSWYYRSDKQTIIESDVRNIPINRVIDFDLRVNDKEFVIENLSCSYPDMRFYYINNTLIPNNVSDMYYFVDIDEENYYQTIQNREPYGPYDCYFIAFGPSYTRNYVGLQVTNIIHSHSFNFALDKQTRRIVIFQIEENYNNQYNHYQVVNYRQLCQDITTSFCFTSYDRLFPSNEEIDNFFLAYRNNTQNFICYKIEYNGENQINISETLLEFPRYISNIQRVFNIYHFLFITTLDELIILNFDYSGQTLSEKKTISNRYIDCFEEGNKLFCLTQSTLEIMDINKLYNDEFVPDYSFSFNSTLLKLDYIETENINEYSIIYFGIITQTEILEVVYQSQGTLLIEKVIKFENTITNLNHIVTERFSNYYYSYIFDGSKTYIVKRNIPNYTYGYGAKFFDKKIFGQETELFSVTAVRGNNLIAIISQDDSLLLGELNLSQRVICKFSGVGFYRFRYAVEEECTNEICSHSEWENKYECLNRERIICSTIYITDYFVSERYYINEWRAFDTVVVVLISVLFLIIIAFVIYKIIIYCKKRKTQIQIQNKKNEPNLTIQRKETTNSNSVEARHISEGQILKDFSEKKTDDIQGKGIVIE